MQYCTAMHVHVVSRTATLHLHRVTESKNKDYTVGDLLVAFFGWRSHTISDGIRPSSVGFGFYKVDPSIPLSPSTSLGILGMTG